MDVIVEEIIGTGAGSSSSAKLPDGLTESATGDFLP
jgi:hypothetical protein